MTSCIVPAPVTVYLFKAFSENPGAIPVVPSQNSSLLTTDSAIQNVKNEIFAKGPFSQIVSGPDSACLQTALLFTNKEIPSVIGDGSKSDFVSCSWRQVELGSFEGKNAQQIRNAYAKTHPKEHWIPEPCSCLNYPWENQGNYIEKPYTFEPFKTDFENRIKSALEKVRSSHASDSNPAIVFCPDEPLRTAILLAEPSNECKMTEFYNRMVNHRKSEIKGSIQDFGVSRFNLVTPDGSWIKLRLQEGRIYLCEVSDTVTYRERAPIPACYRSCL